MSNINNSRRIYTIASLFCGAGGLDMGFENRGFKTVWANDFNEDACATFKSWSNAVVACGDISKIDYSLIPKTDIVLGGWPCPGYSAAGPRDPNDKRNILYRYYVKLLEQNQPYAFIGENVKGMKTLDGGKAFDAIKEDLKSTGYDVFPLFVNSSDYGVPQDRERIILVGFRNDLKVKAFEFPNRHGNRITLREALMGMPEPLPEEICTAPYSSRYMSRNRKRGWDDVSYTIPAMAKQVTLHPSSPDMVKIDKDLWRFGDNGVTRRLSWREAAVIQTFPRDLEFIGDLVSKYRQIGNAVPVRLAEVVAEKVYLTLDSYLAGITKNSNKVGPRAFDRKMTIGDLGNNQNLLLEVK
jgi:DNA (cytosine-5)-methyltransferase 1